MRHRVDITLQGDHVDVKVNGRRVQRNAPPAYDQEQRRRDWAKLQKAEAILREMPLEDHRWARLCWTLQDWYRQYHDRYGSYDER